MVIYQLCDKKIAMKSGVFRLMNKILIYLYTYTFIFMYKS
jgi:hypothetical protein